MESPSKNPCPSLNWFVLVARGPRLLVSSILLPRAKPAGRGGPGGLPLALPLDAAVPRGGAMLRGSALYEGGRGWPQEEPTRFARKRGAREVSLNQRVSGSWDSSPSGFPRLAAGLLHYRLGRYYAVGRSPLGNLGPFMQYLALLCLEALVFSPASLHRRDQNSSA